jgi:hypothetical protein
MFSFSTSKTSVSPTKLLLVSIAYTATTAALTAVTRTPSDDRILMTACPQQSDESCRSLDDVHRSFAIRRR